MQCRHQQSHGFLAVCPILTPWACPAYGCPPSQLSSQALPGESLKLQFVTPGRECEREVCQNVIMKSSELSWRYLSGFAIL